MANRSDDGGLDRRDALRHLGGTGAAVALAGCYVLGPKQTETTPVETPAEPPRNLSLPDRPNVVIVYVDDMGWLDTAFQGSEYYETPNLDALAADGLTFSAGYADAPNCAPSRACLLTGQSTPRHGVYTVRNPDEVAPNRRKLDPPSNNLVLPTDHVTIAELLSAVGYTTGFVGKWHVGEAGSKHGPVARGFDTNVGGGIYGQLPSGYFPPYNLPNLSDEGGQYLTDRLTDEVVGFLRDHASDEDPFFMLYSTYSVHAPIQAPTADVQPYRDRPCWNRQCNPRYGGMVSAFDRTIGRITDTLAELGIEDETLLIFSSDNGGVGDYDEVGISGDWFHLTSQGPLRAGKGTLYEGGIRVPTVMSWPGVVPSGEVHTPIVASDFFATVVELAGATDEIPDEYPIDGESLVPLVERNEAPDRDTLFWHFPAYLTGNKVDVFRTRPVSALRAGPWKLHYFYENRKTELYDLRTDLGETENLASERPGKRDALLDRLDSWKSDIGARDPTRR